MMDPMLVLVDMVVASMPMLVLTLVPALATAPDSLLTPYETFLFFAVPSSPNTRDISVTDR